jgi:hypothetical protein
MQACISALALHVCADVPTTGLRRTYPPSVAAPDTICRAMAIARHLGIAYQRTLAGEQVTAAVLRGELGWAALALAPRGLFFLSFSGHTERGEGPIETTRWCLAGGGLDLATIAGDLARLPPGARLIVLCDTCYAAAITSTLVGDQEVIVVGSCAEDQTMLERRSSEFMVRLEQFVRSGAQGSLDELRAVLEADTPDCERPFVWTNVDTELRAGGRRPAARLRARAGRVRGS